MAAIAAAFYGTPWNAISTNFMSVLIDCTSSEIKM